MRTVKYCGIRTLEDYEMVSESLGSYVGFIFYEKSKRFVTPEAVKGWGPKAKRHVGVFVNASDEWIDHCITHASLDVVQLHGTESLSDIQRIKNRYEVEVWKAIPHGEDTISLIHTYAPHVGALLLDSKVDNAFGGTGKTFDWSFLPKYMEVMETYETPLFVAGGITVDNIHSLLTYDPFGIDLSSGIEEDGKKSKQKLQEIEREIQK
ncbi:phosphoribosylanthranilate isomerase [Priestia koreensis]|uniref:phosphoribosylanthranilate isomerase n=1 Tax=Priestia koreensis TaxID=284581 RepID=UPI001F57265C|nr:phosphoribosylanthranilate isomerase [Priestia koreensis]MCM3003912.1 phosphoribosylanthranilate isomerase [Priestia koreensis]UNL84011.1 phosphoribosylanthranilate isomerase [Priestia koreensis]